MSHIPDDWQVAAAACLASDCQVVTNKSQLELVYTGKNMLRRAYLSGQPLHSLVDSLTLIISSVLRTCLACSIQHDVLHIYIRYHEWHHFLLFLMLAAAPHFSLFTSLWTLSMILSPDIVHLVAMSVTEVSYVSRSCSRCLQMQIQQRDHATLKFLLSWGPTLFSRAAAQLCIPTSSAQ